MARRIEAVLIERSCIEYLLTHQLTEHWQKAKAHILAGRMSSIQFRKRQPASDEVYYFRLTKKYRAWCYFSAASPQHLIIYEIDDHQ